jgi:hypothetical protein
MLPLFTVNDFDGPKVYRDEESQSTILRCISKLPIFAAAADLRAVPNRFRS